MHQLAPQGSEISEDGLDLTTYDVVGESPDGGDLDVIATTDGEDERVPLQTVGCVRDQPDVGRGVVGVWVHGVGAVEGPGRWKTHVVRLEDREGGHNGLSVGGCPDDRHPTFASSTPARSS